MIQPHPELHPGMVVGRFRVIRPLREGGPTRAFLAEHETLGSLHVVKLMSAPSPERAARLVQEGLALTRLRHENLVSLTDVVQLKRLVGLVMDYVDGPSLREHLDEVGTLSLPDALALFAQILAGVTAAHAAGVPHLDLKPANVMLQPTSRGLAAKVADQGIAGIRLRDSAGRARPGHATGTPGYLAPEQVADAARADARADLFALGAMLYEMLAGQAPFAGLDLRTANEHALRGRYMPLDQVLSDCPPHVAEAVARCLRPDPAERFADCAALSRALSEAAASRREALDRPVVIEQRNRREAEAPRAGGAAMEPELGGHRAPPATGASAAGTSSPLAPPPAARDNTPAPLAEIRARAAARAEAPPPPTVRPPIWRTRAGMLLALAVLSALALGGGILLRSA